LPRPARPPPANSPSRQVAAGIIATWLETADFPDRLLENIHRDRAVITEIVLGVVRRRRSIEWSLDRCMKRRPRGATGACLLAGAYEALFMDASPDHAVVNETVESAKTLAGSRTAGLVNGVLRRIVREREAILRELEQADLGIRESHPDTLVRRWLRRFGENETLALCRWNNTRARTVIRVNLRKCPAAEYLARLKDAGIDAEAPAPGEYLQLPPGARVAELPGYREGFFSVQDPSTEAAVELLDPRPGERVLDACAAPGGKTILAAERMAGKGALVAMDLHGDRLPRLRENVARMGLAACIVQGDAARVNYRALPGGERFDRVLLDVPCTNTGVLRRRPDARWRFATRRMEALGRTQRRILDHMASAVKSGGCLVYSTCSLEPEENQELVEAWCRARDDFEMAGTVSLFPPESGTDGVFAAKLVRLS